MLVRFLPSGDTALTVQFEGLIDVAMSRRVIALSKRLRSANIPGIIETVPTYRSLLVHYSPLLTTQSDLIESIEPLIDLPVNDNNRARDWQLPVCFDGPGFAPDLETVAHWAGTDASEIIDTLLTTQLYVYMIGFAAGQPYLGDLPETLAIPRRTTPIANMPTGSILVATGKAVIYPCDNPTGWYAVGRTPVKLFDLQRHPVALLAAGDTVSFHRVEYEQFYESHDATPTETGGVAT